MILVVAEHKDNKLKPITGELLVFAQRLARDFSQPVAAAVLAANADSMADELRSRKIDRVIAVNHDVLADYSPHSYISALKSIIEKEEPFIVLIGHTTQGMDFAPRLAASIRHPLIAGCVEYEKQGDRLVLSRQIFNAKMSMKTGLKGEPPYFATASPGAFPADEVETGGTAEVVKIPAEPAALRRKVIERVGAPRGKADLRFAPMIVSGGRGLKQKED